MKKILIMGATSGIGLQLAEEYAARGWKVGAAGRSAGQLSRLAALYPDGIVSRAIDINSADAPVELEALIGEMGGMDVYLHVAGIGYDNLPLRSREEIAVMETNVTGFTRIIKSITLSKAILTMNMYIIAHQFIFKIICLDNIKLLT
jgi:short-subunit dehydrogenase